MSKVKALIFDFNGTLFWDSDINFRAWNKSVNSWFNRDYTQEEYRIYNGRTGYDTVAGLFDWKLSDEQTRAYLKIQNENYFSVCMSEPKLNLAPGIEDLLAFAKKKDLICAVATSAADKNMDGYYSILPMGKLFDRSLVTCNNGNYRSKPSPDVFIGAMKNIGCEPDECIAFEDTDSGLTSAYTAGIKNVVAVTGDNTSELKTKVPYIANVRDFADPLLRDLILKLI